MVSCHFVLFFKGYKMKKVQIGNRIYNVETMQNVAAHPELYNAKFTAIEGHGMVMPIQTRQGDCAPGYYYHPGDMCCNVILPQPEDMHMYSTDNIIDFTNVQNIRDIYANNARVDELRRNIMVNDDNVMHLAIMPETTKAMAALKEAINNKGINLELYQNEFGETYQNDKRLIVSGSDITLKKLLYICNILGIEVELTLRDMPNVPYPMNTNVSAVLTDQDGGINNE